MIEPFDNSSGIHTHFDQSTVEHFVEYTDQVSLGGKWWVNVFSINMILRRLLMDRDVIYCYIDKQRLAGQFPTNLYFLRSCDDICIN